MPQAELHYALVNVSREPFLYGSILQDEDSYQVGNCCRRWWGVGGGGEGAAAAAAAAAAQADACSTDPPSSTIHLLSNVSGAQPQHFSFGARPDRTVGAPRGKVLRR